jgi:hypothetical protein
MNGPEHYARAEQLIDDANKSQADNGPDCGAAEILAEAQVHATLALAAATAAAEVRQAETNRAAGWGWAQVVRATAPPAEGDDLPDGA